jgi:CheY-like chemotaxis protein
MLEDTEDDVIIVLRAFERLPIPVETTHIADGHEALTLINELNPLNEFFDLVLLDSHLPKVSGLDLLKALRNADPEGLVPIVLLIGALGDDFSEHALEFGADACMVKPLLPEAFMAKVHRIAETWLGAD